MSTSFMLDTNVVSTFMHGRNRLLDTRISAHVKPELCLSAISYGETLYGLIHKPDAVRLAATAEKLFSMVAVLPWTTDTARRYGELRAEMRRIGKSLQPLDMLIAAHALDAGAVLVSSDRAFTHVPGLTVEDWTAA
jgi:tRNA(fMet)-specific endonuclease VapC